MKVGLARVSSVGQNLESQMIALKEYGCEKIFTEKQSGTSTKGRKALREPRTKPQIRDRINYDRVNTIWRKRYE